MPVAVEAGEIAGRGDAEILAAALGIGAERARAAAEEVEKLGGLHALYFAGPEGLGETVSPAARRRLGALLELARRLVSPVALPPKLTTAEEVAAYFRPRLVLTPTESFWVVMLDARARPLATECLAQGTLTSCLVHPREVFAAAIRCRAAQIIVVHNHPSGDPAPSEEDHELTERLADAGRLIGIPLVDHVIVARDGFRSIGVLRGG